MKEDSVRRKDMIERERSQMRDRGTKGGKERKKDKKMPLKFFNCREMFQVYLFLDKHLQTKKLFNSSHSLTAVLNKAECKLMHSYTNTQTHLHTHI